MNKFYQIKKTKIGESKTQYAEFLTIDGKIFETSCFGIVIKMCEILNSYSNHEWRYEILTLNEN